jgi:heme/copper-type cytochrome/quinol oxidase subunit 2
MSFREKSAWIAVLSYLGVYGLYFRRIAQAAAAGEADTFHYGALLAATMIVLVVVQIVLLIAVAIAGPRDAKAPRDERERLIELKAARIAFVVLSCLVLTVCWLAAFNPPGFYTVNALFLALVLSEIVRNASQIAYYRSRL